MPVKGLQQVLANIDKAEKIIQEDVKDTIEKWTDIILREARTLLTSGGSDLKTTYGSQHTNTQFSQFLDKSFENDGYRGIVFVPEVASLLSIYLEFGTGASAAGYVPELPPEIQLIAATFFKNGKGTLLRRPFLIPAFFNNYGKFLLDLQKVLRSHGINSVVIQ